MTFLSSDTWRNILDGLILRLEYTNPNQDSIDTFYDEMMKDIFNEMDKHIRYKEASKSTRKLYRNHKPFWTDELTDAWRDMSLAEKTYVRNRPSNSSNLREIFISKRKYFDKLLRKTERAYNRHKAIEIEKINTENPTEFWKQINALGPKRSNTVPMQVYDETGNKTSDENYVLDKWKNEFSNLYNMPSELNSSFDGDFYKRILSSLSEIKRFELDNSDANSLSYNTPFTLEEMNKICTHIKQGKSVGPDMIPNEVLRHVGVRALLMDFINFCFIKNVIPSIWRKSIITPIPKSASKDPCVPLNYRGISLLSCMYKIYPVRQSFIIL